MGVIKRKAAGVSGLMKLTKLMNDINTTVLITIMDIINSEKLIQQHPFHIIKVEFNYAIIEGAL